ncbi:NAD(P)-dependent oxidoreductase [Actinomadura opuntiae]|uniref:NAD(P)-dependent oxidoreductase n=1 Tax=Actinomadura sp. OS1-43 TaxID=604315 RepID=UPI00255B0702|nr:NAD(P)H-binding protein [Actinomadura sp. OS1-43]MDL4819726.1 NAD(P)H-binding protein [Actinomadura sp. OS1-43]
MNIVVFGAGGRAGRQAVAEARRRGHQVTAVVRDPARHGDLDGARVVAGDVTDEAGIEQAAAGHDAAISAAVDLSVPPHDFFTTSARALVTGLTKAGVRRLVLVGIATVMPGASGTRLMDEPGFPDEFRPFSLGHAAGLEELRASDLDWAYIAPAGDFDHDGARTGRYELADHGDMARRISYADFAIALLDEVDAPRHHRTAVSIREA